MRLSHLRNINNRKESCLIIGNGPSTKSILNKKLDYDVVIGVNRAMEHFPLDYWMVMEADAIHYDWLKNTKNKCPLICNKKIAHRLPNKNTIPCWRKYEDHFNLSNPFIYKHDAKPFIKKGDEALLIGPINKIGLSVGTVVSQAIHFACILNVGKIDIIGFELFFDKNVDHYYGGQFYRDDIKKHTRDKDGLKLVTVDGKLTVNYFADSVPFLRKLIKNVRKERELNILSRSLLCE